MSGRERSTDLLSMGADAVTAQFGGDFSSNAFVSRGVLDALPVIIPAYNRDPAMGVSRLPWTLASLALASRKSGQAIRPLIVINGPQDGPVPQICHDFNLSEDDHVIQQEEKGKVRAIQSAVDQLLGVEAYTGIFATTDDDVVVPNNWPARVVAYMRQAKQDAVSGGSIQYYKVPGVSSALLGLRNRGVSSLEKRYDRRSGLLAHGNNQWFVAGSDNIVQQAVQGLDSAIGRGGDAAIVTAIQEKGGLRLPMDFHPDGRIQTAGDRTKTYADLVKTALSRAGSRYDDPVWGDMTPFNPGS